MSFRPTWAIEEPVNGLSIGECHSNALSHCGHELLVEELDWSEIITPNISCFLKKWLQLWTFSNHVVHDASIVVFDCRNCIEIIPFGELQWSLGWDVRNFTVFLGNENDRERLICQKRLGHKKRCEMNKEEMHYISVWSRQRSHILLPVGSELCVEEAKEMHYFVNNIYSLKRGHTVSTPMQGQVTDEQPAISITPSSVYSHELPTSIGNWKNKQNHRRSHNICVFPRLSSPTIAYGTGAGNLEPLRQSFCRLRPRLWSRWSWHMCSRCTSWAPPWCVSPWFLCLKH